MFEFIGKFFKKEEVKDEITAENIFADTEIKIEVDCSTCLLRSQCFKKDQPIHECENAISIPNYNPELDTILIIDDNEGMISFLMDDMEYFVDKKIIDTDKYNILPITGVHAAFTLKLLYEKLPRLNIKFAIIDITLGGSKMTSEGNIKYTGVDAFEMMYSNNPDFNFLFYTGNNLNPYIKANEKLITQFNKITECNIKDYVLFKTSMDINSRRDYITKYLFKK